MDQSQNDVNLNYLTPVVTTDGHVVMLSDQGVPTILFFQARQQHDEHMHADVVAAVRMNTIEDLEKLSETIKDTIRKHKNREP
jgi:hypothetical protein